MTGYIDKAVDEFPKDIAASVVSPTSEHLFKINKNANRLSKVRGYSVPLDCREVILCYKMCEVRSPAYHIIAEDKSARSGRRIA